MARPTSDELVKADRDGFAKDALEWFREAREARRVISNLIAALTEPDADKWPAVRDGAGFLAKHGGYRPMPPYPAE